MATLTPSVNLWVKSEIFNIGVLPVPPHPRLNVHNIKKIVIYAKSKGKNGFPNLSYSVWKHIACNKLQLTEDLAWTYFVTFDVVNDVQLELRREKDKRFARCASPLEIDNVKMGASVPMLKFALFLYLQQLQKISLRASLVSGSDEWPTRARSPDLEGRIVPSSGKTLDEHSHMTFVLSNLNEIMELLIEPDSYSGGSGVNDLSLSIDAVEALGFVIGGSVDNNRTIRPLKDIAQMQQVHQTSGYSKVSVETSRSPKGWKLRISRSYSFRSLQSWLRSHIGQNPFGVSSCIAQGRRLSWPLAGGKDARADNKRGRIATNALLVPKDTKNKLIVMSQVCKQTVARSSSTLEGSTIKIHRCHNSFLYLLSPLRAVSVEKCRNSTIVLGPVETAIHINHCDGTTVIAACRRITTSGSTSCTFYVMTPTRPLIYSGNDNIMLAPYHTHYPKLEEHMERVGLSPQPSMWDQPLCIGPDHMDDKPVWDILSPRNFYVFAIPFEMEGDTRSIPGGLPTKYQKAMMSRERQIESWQKMVKDTNLAKDQRKQFQALVESRFQEWLADSGHKRELDGLVVPMLPSRMK